MKAPGFQFQETMTGTYTLTGAADSPKRLSFTAKVTAPDALQHLQDGMADMEGTVDMEGFADDVPMTGTLEIRPVTRRIIRYEFSFVANDGKSYRFAGQKDIRLFDLIGSWTTLPAAITDSTGKEVARAKLKFDLKADILPFLASFKTRRAGA